MKAIYLFTCFSCVSLFAENPSAIEQELTQRFCSKRSESKTERAVRSLKNLKELEVSLSDLYSEFEEEDSLQVDEENDAESALAKKEAEPTDLRVNGFEEEVQKNEQSLPQKCNQAFLLEAKSPNLDSNGIQASKPSLDETDPLETR